MTDETDQATVEAVARAIWERPVGYKRIPWDWLDAEDQDVFRAYARAAIAAYERASGWRPDEARVKELEAAMREAAILLEVDGGMWALEVLNRALEETPTCNDGLQVPTPPAPDAGQHEKGGG